MSTLNGPLLMVCAMAGFSTADAFIKTLSVTVPVGQVGVLLGLGGALILGALASFKGAGLGSMRALRGVVLFRNIVEMLASMFMMLGLALAPFNVVTSVLQAMPLVVTLAAALFLGEAVGWRRWSAILVGFVGVLMIVRPGLQGFDPYALLPLGAVVMLSARDLSTRNVPKDVTSLQLSGWGFLALIPSGILLLILRGETPVMMNATEWVFQVLMVVIGVLGYGALVLATRTSDIGLTTPFRYSRLVFGILIGVVVFGEQPDALTFAGSGLIVVAGLYTLMREMTLRRIKTGL